VRVNADPPPLNRICGASVSVLRLCVCAHGTSIGTLTRISTSTLIIELPANTWMLEIGAVPLGN
jgi:hypothetical protein